MSSDSSNDNTEAGNSNQPDAHGQAAILLVESLIHGLIARDVITVADAVEIVDIAAEVEEEVATDREEPSGDVRQSLRLLGAISSSLSRDI